mgnify:CR=1 FL=1
MLKQRVITAIILGAALLAILFLLPFKAFVWLSLAVFGYAAFEWSKLAQLLSLGQRLGYAVGAVLLSAGIYFGLLDTKLWTLTGDLTQTNYNLMLIACIWWLISCLLILIYPRGNRVWQKHPVAKALFGYLTIVPAWLALLTIREWRYLFDASYGAWLALFVFGLVWAADIGAYFAGKKFGARKLMPNVSPGKTI